MEPNLFSTITGGHTLLFAYLIAVNAITFAAFCIDKRRAILGQWRIKEATLLGLSLIGGSIGGIIAMRVAHHKTRKPAFRFGLPAMLVFHCLVFGYLLAKGLG